MALGYGSEFHLLRWIGRHRNEFDNRVKSLLSIDIVHWLDFDFAPRKDIADKEITGLNFLDEEKYKSILLSWKKEWPQTGNSMNWDLVGYTENNNEKTWILIEAKAHLDELKQNCEASCESLKKIELALSKCATNQKITILENNTWTKQYYQFANRIYILDFLQKNNIKAKLVNVYFIGDLNSKSRKSPQSIDGWKTSLTEMKKYLNIQDLKKIDISDLYLEIDK